MSLILVGGAILAIDGIPIDMGTIATLTAPTVSITDIDQDDASSPLTVSVLISNRDPAATGIILHFFVRSAQRPAVSVSVANANGTVTVELPAGYVLGYETLYVRATSATATALSNPGPAASMVFTPPAGGAALPATLPFLL